MRFYEFESKKVLAKYGIPFAEGELAKTPEEAEKIAADLGGPVAIKSQILASGRAAAGGVKFAGSPAEAKEQAAAILALEINGQKPVAVRVERKIDVKREFAVQMTYDGVAKRPVMIASDIGSKNLDDVADEQPDRVQRRHFSTLGPMRNSVFRAKELVRSLGLTGQPLNRMTQVVSRLAEAFLEYDLTTAEINALGETEDGKFIALDCYMDMEEEGRFRQQALLEEFGIPSTETRSVRGEPTPMEREAHAIDAEDPRGLISPFVEFDGNMGLVIGAGGGSLTIFDAVKRQGGNPANYAAIGGNPSVGKAQRLTKLVLGKKGVDKIAVMSNVVSNTRADLVARGVIKGVLEMGLVPSEVITIFRCPGAWEADAFKILEKYGVEYCDRTVSLSEAAKRAVAKVNG
ncbi:MAG: acetate--CoA ligase family protein [Myxococcales bacterium]|nr:acetate--CoA ligase family protein [Myxococcales bacterium]